MKFLSRFLPAVLLFFFVSCKEETRTPVRPGISIDVPIALTPVTITAIHDQFCIELCDSVAAWMDRGLTYGQIISTTYNTFLIGKMANTLGMTTVDVENAYTALGINAGNYTTFAEVYKDSIPAMYADFMESMELALDASTDSDSILSELEKIRLYYHDHLDPTEVDAIIAVAKSSSPFWNDNTPNCVYGDPYYARRNPCREQIALSDVTGGLWGITGGLIGVMFGAIGGTLGSAVVSIAYGGCP